MRVKLSVRWLIPPLAVIVMAALVVGTWQVAYGRGRDEGRAAATAVRDAFVQGRPGGAGSMVRIEKPVSGAGPDGTVLKVEPVEGTIERIDGRQAIVKTGSGSVAVTLRDQTAIRRVEQLDAGRLKAGDRVVILGEKGSDGAVAADAVEVQQ